MISVKESSLDERWNMFENAATYRYGRSILDKEKKIKTWNTNSNFRGKMTTASKYVSVAELPSNAILSLI